MRASSSTMQACMLPRSSPGGPHDYMDLDIFEDRLIETNAPTIAPAAVTNAPAPGGTAPRVLLRSRPDTPAGRGNRPMRRPRRGAAGPPGRGSRASARASALEALAMGCAAPPCLCCPVPVRRPPGGGVGAADMGAADMPGLAGHPCAGDRKLVAVSRVLRPWHSPGSRARTPIPAFQYRNLRVGIPLMAGLNSGCG